MAIAARKAEADALFRQRRHADAAAAYADALRMSEALRDPSLLHLLYANRAAALLALGQWQAALADALASISVDESYAKAHYRAAAALEALGRPVDALRHAARAAELDPSSKDAAALAARMRDGAAKGAADAAAAAPAAAPAPDTPAAAAPPSPASPAAVPGAGAGGAAAGAAAVDPAAAAAAAAAPLTQARALALVPPQMRTGSRFVASPDGLDSNVLVLLHGMGDRSDGFAALAKHMALPQTACLALSGPLEIPLSHGGRAWFTAFDDCFHPIRPSPGEKRRARSLRAAAAALLPLLPALAGVPAGTDGGGGASGGGGAPRRRVHLFGFSQGGCVALELARRLCGGGGSGCDGGGGGGSGVPPAWLGSVVSVSGSLLEEELGVYEKEARATQQVNEKQQEGRRQDAEQEGRQQLAAVNGGGAAAAAQAAVAAAAAGGALRRRVPVLITHGDKDTTVLRTYVERSAALLESLGCDVTLHSVPGKRHAMVGADRAEAEALMRFYSKALSVRPPGEGFVEVGGGA